MIRYWRIATCKFIYIGNEFNNSNYKLNYILNLFALSVSCSAWGLFNTVNLKICVEFIKRDDVALLDWWLLGQWRDVVTGVLIGHREILLIFYAYPLTFLQMTNSRLEIGHPTLCPQKVKNANTKVIGKYSAVYPVQAFETLSLYLYRRN